MKSENSQAEGINRLSLGLWLINGTIFLLLPCLLIAWGVSVVIEGKIETERQREFTRLNELLLAIRKRADTRRYLEVYLQRIGTLGLPGKSIVIPALRRGFREIRRRFPIGFSFGVVDAVGNVVPAVSDGVPSRTVMKYLAQTVRLPEATVKATPAGTPRWPIVQSFIGPQTSFRNFHLGASGRLQETAYGEKRHYFFFLVRPAGCLFVHVDEPPDFSLLSIRDLVNRVGRRPRFADIHLRLHDISVETSLPPLEAKALGLFQNTNQENVEIQGALFGIIRLGAHYRLTAQIPFRARKTLETGRLACLALLGGFFFLGSVLSFRFTMRESAFFFPIRHRLVLLFVFASGLPVSVLVFFALGYFSQLHQSHVRKTFQAVEKALWAFDDRFPELRSSLEGRLKTLLKSLRFDTSAHQEEVIGSLKLIEKRYQPSNVLLFDSAGKMVWQDSDQGVIRSSTPKRFLGQFVRSILGNLNQEVDNRIDAASLIAETVGEGESPLRLILKNVGKISDLSLEKNQMWNLMIPIKGAGSTFSHMAVFLWRKHHLEQFYLKRYLLAGAKAIPGMRLTAFSPHRRPSLIPFDQWAATRMKDFFQDLRVQGKSMFTSIPRGENHEIIVGIQPKEIAQYFLIGRVSDATIRREVRELQKKLVFFLLAIALISFYLGRILSRRFLDPLGRISSGVQAIRQRLFSFRLPHLGNDEFGDLGNTFNVMMEDMADLEVARIVQESLMPSDEICRRGYQIFGETHTASRLGGDFFDLKNLDENRILIVIGDVTGHGVPAALVMAIAKSALETVLETSKRPEELIGGMNRIIHRTMRRKLIMTCFVGILDIDSHTLHFSNGGHNYPYLLRRGEPPEHFKTKVSYPLGTLAKTTFEVSSIAFSPGDALFFYTDGIIEARTWNGIIGYPRVAEKLDTLRHLPPKAACGELFAWYQELAGDGRQDDDITFIMIRRESTEIEPLQLL
jgi:HAMP domain-containing protein